MTIDLGTEGAHGKRPVQNMDRRRIIGATTVLDHVVKARLPTDHGLFTIHIYEDSSNKQHLALVMGDISDGEGVLTRVHSECLTGDLFGSLRCDCQSQLHQSIEMISEEGRGIIIYLRQEGRGIGLPSKLHSYNLQDMGYDTVDANTALGYEPDEREYDEAALILQDLGVHSIDLITNNQDKSRSFNANDIQVLSVINIAPRVTKENRRYLRTKTTRLNHAIDVETASTSTPEIDRLFRFMKRMVKMKGPGSSFVTVLCSQSLNGSSMEPTHLPKDLYNKELEHLVRRLEDFNSLSIDESSWGPVRKREYDTTKMVHEGSKGVQGTDDR